MSDTPQPRRGLGVKIEPVVTYGHLFTAAIFLFTGAVAWADLNSRQKDADVRIARLERLQEEGARDASRAREVLGRLEEKVEGLNRALNRLDNTLNRISPVIAPPPTNSGPR
jgi:septal ring factor EnvC (AmiA/AmiB activator)